MKKLIIPCILLFSVCCNPRKSPEKAVDEALQVPHSTLLTRNKWKLEAYIQEPAYHGVTDVYAKMADCAKDNLFVFNKDGTYSVDAGFTKCSDSEPQTIATGTWEFERDRYGILDESLLIINAGGKKTRYYISDLTDSRLKLHDYLQEGDKRYSIYQTFRNVK